MALHLYHGMRHDPGRQSPPLVTMIKEPALKHDKTFEPNYGKAIEVADGIRRLTCENPGPFTFHGTNTYLVGTHDIVVIDPGPADPVHIGNVMRAAGTRTIKAILVSHTHVDHSPGARMLQLQSGAPIAGCGPHHAARALALGENNPMDASSDSNYAPDQLLGDGDLFTADGVTFEAIATPGHTANHLSFAVRGTEILFSADHVMAWSTSIVAPPDGAMPDYMTSLATLLARKESLYFPGHGGAVRDAHDYVTELKVHRLNRELSILESLTETPVTISHLVPRLYEDLPPALHPAAALSVFAHLEDLTARGLARAAPGISLTAFYTRGK